jgi:hypothetical protein
MIEANAKQYRDRWPIAPESPPIPKISDDLAKVLKGKKGDAHNVDARAQRRRCPGGPGRRLVRNRGSGRLYASA